MIDTNPVDPGMKRNGARNFFYAFFMADYLRNQHGIDEAVQEYLDEESDPNGVLLLQEAEELLSSGMSEGELKNLIENTWKTRSPAKAVYKDILKHIITNLRERS